MNKISIEYDKASNFLSSIMKNYGSDKGSPHEVDITPSGWIANRYTDIYHILFGTIRDSATKIFECGIGTNNEDVASNMTSNGAPGASLRGWRDYFWNAHIYGADIDKRILFEEERIKTYYVDQTKPESIQKMWEEINEYDFDVILDDGLHEAYANITLLENSWDRLKHNGIYIIEDAYYTHENIKKYLKEKGYNFIFVTFDNTASYCFVIFKTTV
jgi:hypothetical protein